MFCLGYPQKRDYYTSGRNFASKNYYERLGVQKTASEKEIKKAYYQVGTCAKYYSYRILFARFKLLL